VQGGVSRVAVLQPEVPPRLQGVVQWFQVRGAGVDSCA
jgi:hypothetical protein